VYKAHCIVVLHDGKQAEAGPHEELMKKQGLYSQLVLAFRGEK